MTALLVVSEARFFGYQLALSHLPAGKGSRQQSEQRQTGRAESWFVVSRHAVPSPTILVALDKSTVEVFSPL